MVRRIIYSRVLKVIFRICFGIFYDKNYLRGFYFDSKRLGWYWALRGIIGKLVGNNKNIPWPVHPNSIVSNSKNIEFNVDDIYVFQTPGCYWQNQKAKIRIGRQCYVAPNVGLITTNHDIYDLSKHVDGKEITLGDFCWIGMNSVILPGVELGPHTIVGAGSVVTKSFPEGYCVVGGNPAKVIRNLEKTKFTENGTSVEGKYYADKK